MKIRAAILDNKKGFADLTYYVTPDGSRLPVRIADSNANMEHNGCAIIQLCHGLAEHSLRYQNFARRLNAAGFHVIAHDHRGHGYHQSAASPLGRFAWRHGDSAVLSDVHFVNQQARQQWPGLPIILFGHSMGGLIALAYLAEHANNIDASAIWNANFSTPLQNKLGIFLLALERMFKGSDVPSRILPTITFRAWAQSIPNHHTDFDWLSHDTSEVQAYIDDPLCGFAPSTSMWLDILALMQRGFDRQKLQKLSPSMPLHLLGGKADPATSHGKSMMDLQDRLQKLGLQNLTCKIWPQNRHESLMEINKDQVMDDFITWLHRHFRNQ